MFHKKIKHQISLLTIITIIITFCMATPLLVTSFYFYGHIKSNEYVTMKKNLTSSIENSCASLDSNLLSIKNTYYAIISDPLINPQLYGNISNVTIDTPYSKEVIDDRLSKIFMFSTLWTEKILNSVALFDSIDSYHYIDNTKSGYLMDEQSLNALQGVTNHWSFIANSIESNKRINMFFHSTESNNSIYYIRDFYNYSSGTFQGLISFQMNEELITKYFNDLAKYEGSVYYVYDSIGNIISSNSDVNNSNLENTQYNGTKIMEVMNDYENYFIKTIPLSNFDLTVATIIPLIPIEKQLFGELKVYIFFFVLLFISVIIIAVLLSRFISQYINILIKRMSAVQLGDYTQIIPHYGIIEIDNLSIAFSNMSSQIKKLLDEVYANEILLKESELKALQAQINPHFLFNTLLSISWKARANKDMETYNMINALSSLLNASIYTRATKFISIAEEIQNVNYYLFIQKSRFGERITYDIDITPELLKKPILKLTLQPIVENSIIHGIENKVGNGHILIKGSVLKNEIVIKILDNGVGFDPKELTKNMSYYNHSNKPSGHHIGLINTHLRIKYTYGEQYGLSIKSAVGKGTTVLMRFPAKGGK